MNPITLVGYLQSKGIIGDEIGEGSGKYQINVETLTGKTQKYGNGTATESEKNDVYMLEKVDTSTGNLINKKVASTTPIRIASTTTQEVIYKVIYYENNTTDELILGNLSDSITISNPSNPTGDNTDYSTLLYNYYKDMDYQQIEGVNTIDGTDATWITRSSGGNDYVEYKGGIYKVVYADTDAVKEIVKINANVDFTRFGVYQIEENNILITPSTPEHLIHNQYDGPSTYYVDGNEAEYRALDDDDCYRYYNTSGAFVGVSYPK